MKKNILVACTYLFLLFISYPINAQRYADRGRYYDGEESPGLPPLDFAGYALLIGAVLLAVGWLISKNTTKPNGEGGSTFGGCLLMLGVLCVLPAVAWLMTIAASIYVTVIVGLVVIGVLIFVWDKVVGKK